MARITLEFDKLDVNDRDGKYSFTTGQARVKIFDRNNADGIEFDVFDELVNQKDNWVILHKRFQTREKDDSGQYIWREAREAIYSSDSIIVREITDGNDRTYQISEDLVEAFRVVVEQTKINQRELSTRRQHVKAEQVRANRDKLRQGDSITNQKTGTNG